MDYSFKTIALTAINKLLVYVREKRISMSLSALFVCSATTVAAINPGFTETDP